ncbi:CopD family protein [Fulvimarina sp. MAC3]|uniref:copper resistance D family protein n=1 Tax=Fulvimarina sp. MAC3 TaxID=3148887 RepID=UPI0031FCB57F
MIFDFAIAFEGLSDIDAWAIAAIAVKAVGYAAAFLAMGGALFIAVFPELPEKIGRSTRILTASAAVIGLLNLSLRIGVRAARISGMGADGMIDPTMVQIVWESPLGTAAFIQAMGFGLILALLLRGPIPAALSLIGATLVAIAFTEVGHSLGGERAFLAALLTLHVLTGAFWIGAFHPLFMATDNSEGHAILHRFGKIAGASVAVLVLAGLGFAWISVGSLAGLFGTAYGLTLMAKVALVLVLLALAAWNKLLLVPGLRTGEPGTALRLKRSIALECGAVVLIFLLTATLTSVATPPMNLD